MKIHVKTQAAYDPVIRRMAREAGISVEALAEVALYNLISIWVKENGKEHVEGDNVITHPPHDVCLPGRGSGDDGAAPAL